MPGDQRHAAAGQLVGDGDRLFRIAGIVADRQRELFAEHAARLIELAVPEMSQARQEATLCRWFEALPPELFVDRPVLAMIAAGTICDAKTISGLVMAGRLSPGGETP